MKAREVLRNWYSGSCSKLEFVGEILPTTLIADSKMVLPPVGLYNEVLLLKSGQFVGFSDDN